MHFTGSFRMSLILWHFNMLNNVNIVTVNVFDVWRCSQLDTLTMLKTTSKLHLRSELFIQITNGYEFW